jgi:hypothetical protein
MKKIIFIIFLIIAKVAFANTKVITVVSVNNYPITNIDIENEIKILKIFNSNSNQNTNFQKIAINNLINEILKSQEIIQSNIVSDEKFIKKKLYESINEINKMGLKISENIEKIIYKKDKLDHEWNLYIFQKFSWKVNINLDEIENKISNEIKNNNVNNLQKYKEDLINQEKNKKLNIYAINYLELLKKNAVIKYYK